MPGSNPVDVALLRAAAVLEKGPGFLQGPQGSIAIHRSVEGVREAAYALAPNAPPSSAALDRVSALGQSADPSIACMALQLAAELLQGPKGELCAPAVVRHAPFMSAITAALRVAHTGQQYQRKRRVAAIVLRDMLQFPEAKGVVAGMQQQDDPLLELVKLVQSDPGEAHLARVDSRPYGAHGPAWAALGNFLSNPSDEDEHRRLLDALDARCRAAPRAAGDEGPPGCTLDVLLLGLARALLRHAGVDVWVGAVAFALAAVQVYPQETVGRTIASTVFIMDGLLRMVCLAPEARGACIMGCSCGGIETRLLATYAIQARQGALATLLVLAQSHPGVVRMIASRQAAMTALAALIGPPRPHLFDHNPDCYLQDPGPSDDVVVALSLLTLIARADARLRASVALTPGVPAALAALLTPDPAGGGDGGSGAPDPRTRCARVVCGAVALLCALLTAQAGEEMCGTFITRGIALEARQPLLEGLRGLLWAAAEAQGNVDGAAAARFGATLSPQLLASDAVKQCVSDTACCLTQLNMFFNSFMLGGAEEDAPAGQGLFFLGAGPVQQS